MKKQRKFPLQIQSIKKIFFVDTCRICSKELVRTEDILCQKCFRVWKEKTILHYYEGYYFIYFYEGKIREWIHEYKFEHCRPMGKLFAKLIKEAFWECYQEKKIDVVIPVPIHEKRFLQRGFNQTEEILKYLKIPYIKIERIKDTQALFQHHEKEEREEIMKHAFSCPVSLEGKNVLLFDDIVTTGTTMQEMKKAIFKQGKPRTILCFSLTLAERVKIEHRSIQN